MNGSESDSQDDDKMARLTLMEEILLLGLKDREVLAFSSNLSLTSILGLHIVLE